jgi:hypothetical protein
MEVIAGILYWFPHDMVQTSVVIRVVSRSFQLACSHAEGGGNMTGLESTQDALVSWKFSYIFCLLVHRVEQPLIVIRVVHLSRVPSWLQVCLGRWGGWIYCQFQDYCSARKQQGNYWLQEDQHAHDGTLLVCVCSVCVRMRGGGA